MVEAKYLVHGSGLGFRLGVRDIALRKELGSGSDVTGRARWWIRVMQTLALRKEIGSGSDDGLGFCKGKSMRMIRLRREFGFNSDVECQGEIESQETLALRKELGSGSDVTGRARWWIRL
ncbi:Endogenous Retrovirus Group Pablb Member 1 Env Polyprotein, partial [Manis pentadactyla]